MCALDPERPPILTAEGQPKDGNRRIAAAKYVLNHPETFTSEQIEKAQWIRVWQAPSRVAGGDV